MSTITILAFAAGLLGGFGIGLTYKVICDLRKRINDLEKAQAARLPHRTADEIEEATAILNAEIFRNEFRRELLENVRGHLFNARTPGN